MRYSQGDKQASGNRFMCSPYSPESGVRTFTGSRSASVDATFSDHADDCTDNGYPRPQALRPPLLTPCAPAPSFRPFRPLSPYHLTPLAPFPLTPLPPYPLVRFPPTRGT